MSVSTALSETDAAKVLGVHKRTLKAARLAGVVNPRRAGRSFRYVDADLAAFRASRRGLNAKRAAAELGISRSQLARYRLAGRISATPAGGIERIRFLYDVATFLG